MDYTVPEYRKNILSPEEVHFFYYDIMNNAEDSIQFIYDWNNDVQDYLTSKGIVVEVREINDFPKIVEENRLYFVVDKIDKNNKAIAFFRHLRNAFAHFRLVREGEWLNIMDGVWRGKEKDKYWEKTMIGLIKYEDLKELCFIFFKQGDKLIARNIF